MLGMHQNYQVVDFASNIEADFSSKDIAYVI